MEDIASWLCSALRLESITFEPLLSNPESMSAGLLPPDPLAFARGFVRARRVAHNFGVDCVYSPLFDRPRRTVCPVGRDAFLIAPDRSVRSCYLRRRDWQAAGLDMRIGVVTPEGNLDIDQAAVQRLRDVTADRARCGRCLCRWMCAGGCIVTETPPGHCLEYTSFCRQTRLIQVCTLLENLGLAAQADVLLADEQAVARLWEQPCDRMESAG
jgi:radical SAM protein with 4Fe4S-binding SPASM domain